MSYTKFSRWLDDVQDEEAGYYDNSEDDLASYLLNLTNLDHVVDRADAVPVSYTHLTLPTKA